LSTLNDILKAVHDVVVMNERVTALAQRMDRLEVSHSEITDRVTRIEVFIDLVRPVITRRALPPSTD
jgi:hypothetical protein